MPELPEVETMVRDLGERVRGRTIERVDLPFAGSVTWPAPDEFVTRVQGCTVLDVRRRAKFAVLVLDSGDVLIVHRGMSGSLLLRAPDAPMEAHVRAVLHLDNGLQLRFNDPRKFGRLYVMDAQGRERALPWAHMGPEPLAPDFTADILRSRFRARAAPIKSLLLNQQIVAGLGNIYVDEALFAARLHPRRRAHTLTEAEITRLHRAIKEVLGGAVERRGTTFSTYTDIEGRSGEYQTALQVFRRTGAPCPACAGPIERLVVSGRGTHICPRCQPE